jgi:hypothetical protein
VRFVWYLGCGECGAGQGFWYEEGERGLLVGVFVILVGGGVKGLQ